MDLYSLKINNRPFNYLDGLTIFQACLDKHIYVPRFCYHVLLSIAGNCRMCLVEEKSSLKPVASCAVSIANGMTIYTNTELVKKAREGVLEYLLINHPLDCPICDQGGECDLQDQTMVFGADRGRFYENKRAVSNKNLGFLIKTFFNRCIHCTRCTRFLNDVTGSSELQLLGRGGTTEISPFIYKFVTTELSGNIIDLCPVGALTSKPYAFKARPWELATVQTFDIVEPFGSNIELNYRGLELLRVLPKINGEINGEWISDKTRFFYDALNIQRLTTPYAIMKGEYKPLNWIQALYYIINKFKLDFETEQEHSIGFLPGEYTDIRAMLSFGSTLARKSNGFNKDTVLKNSNSDFRVFYLSQFTSEARGLFAGSEFDIEKVFILYTNPRFESPIVNIKLRQLAITKNCVYLIGFLSNLNYEFTHLSGVSTCYQLEILIAKSSLNNILFVTRTDYIFNQSIVGNTQIHRVASDIGSLSLLEVVPHTTSTQNTKFTHIDFFGGQPNLPFIKKFISTFNISFLHHVEDSYWEIQNSWWGIKLPVKFYVEKVSIYVSESAYFFNSLTNIFGVRILGLKDESQILNTVWGLLNTSCFEPVERFFWNLTGWVNFLKIPSMCEIKNSYNQINKSVIHNYYDCGLLVRLSPTLSLCNKRYFIENDYTFGEILKYNAS